MGQGYGAGQGFTAQPNPGHGGNSFNGFQNQPQNAPNQQGNAVNVYNSSHSSFAQTQQQAQTNNYSGPANTFNHGSMPSNPQASYPNQAQQNMQSGAHGNTQSHFQGFVTNFQPQAYDGSDIWGQQTTANIDPQLRVCVQERAVPEIAPHLQATGRAASPRAPPVSRGARHASLRVVGGGVQQAGEGADHGAAQTGRDTGATDEVMAEMTD